MGSSAPYEGVEARRPERLVDGLLAYGTSEVVVRLLLLAVSATIARKLGIEALGQLTLAQTLVLWALVVGDGGLTADAIRRLATGEPANRLVPRVTASQVVLSLLTLVPVLAVASFVMHGSSGFGVVLALSPIPLLYAVDLSYVLQVQRRLRLYAGARIAGQIVSCALALLLLTRIRSLPLIAVTVPIAALVANAIVARHLWSTVKGPVGRPLHRVIWKTVGPARHYLGSAVLTHYYASASLLGVALLANEVELGRSAVAMRLIFLPVSAAAVLGVILFPRLSSLVEVGTLDSYLRRLVSTVVPLTCSVAVLVAFEAEAILVAIFGEGATTGAPVLRILAPLIPLTFFNMLVGSALLASGRARDALVRGLLGAAVLTVASTVFIPRYGASGGAFAFVLGESAMAFVSVALYRRLADRGIAEPARPTLVYGLCTGLPLLVSLYFLPPLAGVLLALGGLALAELRVGAGRRFLQVARLL